MSIDIPEQAKNPETIQTMTEEAPPDTIKNVKPKDWYTGPLCSDNFSGYYTTQWFPRPS
jgi:hypothetical protein